MILKKLLQTEPVAFIGLAITMAISIIPATWNALDNAFFYSEKFDIRCDELSEDNSALAGHTVAQVVSCTIVNNSDSDLSLVGVQSAIFHDRHAYPQLLLPRDVEVKVLPAFLRRGEFHQIKTIYYRPLLSSATFGDAKACVLRENFPPERKSIKGINVCEELKPTGLNPLQHLYRGFSWEFYTFNRLGLVFQLGNGRDVYFSPTYQPNSGPKNDNEIVISPGFIYPKEQWSTPPSLPARVIPAITLILTAIAMMTMLSHSIKVIRNRFKKNGFSLVEIIEKPKPDKCIEKSTDTHK